MALSFLQQDGQSTNATIYTFSAENLGTAAADRYIIIGIGSRGLGSLTLSTVTIGGVSATLVSNNPVVNTNTTITSLCLANVPTGTTGDVVITFSGQMLRCGIGVYRVTGLSSATPTSTGISSADAPTANLNINAGGIAIGTASLPRTSNAAWTGITTQDYNFEPEAGFDVTGAHDTYGGPQTNLACTCTFDGFQTGDTVGGSFASWPLTVVTVASSANNMLLMGV